MFDQARTDFHVVVEEKLTNVAFGPFGWKLSGEVFHVVELVVKLFHAAAIEMH